MTEEKKLGRPKQLTLDVWEKEGVPCYYVRLQQESAPAKDKQPVGEFYTRQNGSKYMVDSIVYTPYGVIWRAYGERNIIPLPNVALARFCTE